MKEIPPGYRVLVVDPDGTQVGEVRLGDNLERGYGADVLAEEVAEEIERHQRSVAGWSERGTRRGARQR